MHVRDLIGESVAGMLARPVRSALTTLGTVLGITTLVVTLGVAATAGNQIVGRFDELVATAITVEVPEQEFEPLVEWTAIDRLTRLRGVESAAAVAESDDGSNLSVRSNDIVDPSRVTTQSLTVLAATTGLPEAARGRMLQGRFYDTGHVRRGDRVAVIGDQAARALGVTRLDRSPAIFIGRHAYTVIGIMGDLRRERNLSTAVIVPPTAGRQFGLRDVTRVLVNTTLGGRRADRRPGPPPRSAPATRTCCTWSRRPAPPGPATRRRTT
ncbi:ABC transporter permease [Nonomuraea salmonea]|uniref:ABC transporter permease n=1 Tax=Nonomuraea salmonea TaxID=46181 RepID=UPI002FE9DE1B